MLKTVCFCLAIALLLLLIQRFFFRSSTIEPESEPTVSNESETDSVPKMKRFRCHFFPKGSNISSKKRLYAYAPKSKNIVLLASTIEEARELFKQTYEDVRVVITCY